MKKRSLFLKETPFDELEIGKWYHVWTPESLTYCGYGKAVQDTSSIYVSILTAPILNCEELIYAQEDPPFVKPKNSKNQNIGRIEA